MAEYVQRRRRDRHTGLGKVRLDGTATTAKEKPIKTYHFDIKIPYFIKEKAKIYEKLKSLPLAKQFLDWCSNVYIRTKDYGVINFSPNIWTYAQWKVAEYLFNEDYEVIYVLKSRQLGITTIVILFDLFYAFAIPNLQGIIVGADYEQIGRPRFLIREIYKSLPPQLKLKTVEDNLVRIKFSNGNYFEYYCPTRKLAKMGTMGRGTAVNFAHFTEFAFVANEEDINAIEASFSSHYPYRKYIYETTANGYNFFYERWTAGKDVPTVAEIFLGWWAREDYRLDNPKELSYYLEKKAFEWEEEKLEETKERYGVDIQPEQLAWWRKQALVKYARDESAVLKELPFTEDDAFSTTGKEYFFVKSVKDAQSIKLPKKIYQLHLPGVWYEMKLYESNFGVLKVWKPWDEKNKYAYYVIGVDPAFSTSETSDNSAFVVLECYADRVEQVAEFSMNIIDTMSFAFLVLYIASEYGAIVNYDVSGGGYAFAQNIQNLDALIKSNRLGISNEYFEAIRKATLREYIYRRRDSLSSGQAKGILWNADLKKRAILTLNSMLINEEIIIRSKNLLKEIENLIVHEGEIVARKTSIAQDLVMALLTAILAYQDIPRSALISYEEAMKKLEETKNLSEKEKKELQYRNMIKSFNEYYKENLLRYFQIPKPS